MNAGAHRKQQGFTIVELLIVVVVIAILATITIIAYNGIRDRAQVSALQTALAQTNRKVLAYAVEHSDAYPDTLDDVGIANSSTVIYQYTSDNTTTPRQYALTATNGPNGNLSYYLSNTQTTRQVGIAPGHNTIVWYKDTANAPLPLNGGVVDTGVSYTVGSKSLRIGPNNNGVGVRGTPFSVTPGQTYTMQFWMITDGNWNGTSDNSKVRFGNGSGGAVLRACGYSGIKTTWTKISCSYTVPSDVDTVTLSVGNNGSVGSIWLDQISLTIQ